MTKDLIESEMERNPFVPFRFHLVSGKTIDVVSVRGAHMLESAVMVFHPVKDPAEDVGYDVISLYNIERIEQMEQ